jgi:phosphopantetheine--protein transferase-like protein
VARSLPPFIREIVSLKPREEAVALCKISLEEHRFLLDHTLGGVVSEVDNGISALSVVPLTFSMEIMAEAAALLMNGKKLVGMRDIRAYHWIGLDKGEKTLQVNAKMRSAAQEEVEVKIYESDGMNTTDSDAGSPVVEGIMIFGMDYPAAPSVKPFPLIAGRRSTWTGANLYDGFMFHGPSLQGVASMDTWGADGALATLRAMPKKGLLNSVSDPDFLSDPVVLDAAGQVIAYWTSDHLEKAYHIFPFRLEALHLYGPGFSVPEMAKCQARINLVEDSLVKSDIDIIASDGKVRMRLLGWWDRRFDQPERFFQLRVSPKKVMLSVPMSKDSGRVNGSGDFICCMLNGLPGDFLTAHDRIWMRVMAHLVLGRKERQLWHSLKGNDKRHTEWLLGRTAAKDAVRLFIRKRDGIDVCPADIEISTDESGRPVVESILGGRVESLPAVSISHSSGIAAAVAAKEGYGVGVDIESLRALKEGFDRAVFTQEERALLRDPENDEWLLRFWCAREAVSKALGTGLMGRPGDLVVKAVDKKTGDIDIEISGKLRAQFPGLAGKSLIANTLLEDNLILAVSMCPAR